MPFSITAFGLYPIPVKKSSWPVLEVSICPLNIRQRPLPVPSQRAITLARPSSTSCQVTSRPMLSQVERMYSAILPSLPVGLGMLITSQHMETSDFSSTSARIFSARLELSVSVVFLAAFKNEPLINYAADFFSRKSSGYEHSFSFPFSVISKSSSSQRPPPP